MSAASTAPPGPTGLAHPTPELLRSRVMAAGLLALSVLLVTAGTWVRTAEAALQTVVLTLAGQESQHIGTAALFRVDGRLVGVSFTTGCSVGPVLALFLGATAVAAAFRPLRGRAVLVATAVLVGLFIGVNQVRVGVIVASMRWLGFDRGYDVSHVFLGSVITTVGFLLALVLFVRLLLAETSGRRR